MKLLIYFLVVITFLIEEILGLATKCKVLNDADEKPFDDGAMRNEKNCE